MAELRVRTRLCHRRVSGSGSCFTNIPFFLCLRPWILLRLPASLSRVASLSRDCSKQSDWVDKRKSSKHLHAGALWTRRKGRSLHREELVAKAI